MKINNLDKIIEDYLIKNEKKLKINSNDILNGDVFVALQGSRTHGNDIFVMENDIAFYENVNFSCENMIFLIENDNLSMENVIFSMSMLLFMRMLFFDAELYFLIDNDKFLFNFL